MRYNFSSLIEIWYIAENYIYKCIFSWWWIIIYIFWWNSQFEITPYAITIILCFRIQFMFRNCSHLTSPLQHTPTHPESPTQSEVPSSDLAVCHALWLCTNLINTCDYHLLPLAFGGTACQTNVYSKVRKRAVRLTRVIASVKNKKTLVLAAALSTITFKLNGAACATRKISP